MMQELLGGAGFISTERKIPVSAGTIFEGTPSHSPSLCPSSPTTTTTSATPNNNNNNNSNSNNNNSGTNSASTSENLRCPRCDSSNTKFCYYNNYNLTQPRHFCKTCRRYWTKGGALRNVPIGGGCRKNKPTPISSSVAKSSNNKMKNMVSEVAGRSSFDHEFSSSPIMWSSPHNSHLLSLLRSNHNPNPNSSPLSTSLVVKEETGSRIGTQITTEPIHARTLGLEHLSQVPLGLCSPFWKNNQQNHQAGFVIGPEAQNSGLQEICQRLRSSSYYTDNSSVVVSNVGTSSLSTSSSNMLESSPVAGSELGYWNPTFPWSDLPTANGATNGAYQ